MNQTAKARIAYVGPALENGEMDVRDLAPALLAFSDLVESANKALGGERRIKVTLNQNSIRAGSFDITMFLDCSFLEQIKLFTKTAEEVGLADLMEVLGWGTTAKGAAASIVVGVLSLIKYMKGKRPEKAGTDSEGHVEIILDDGTKIITTEKTFIVYKNLECRKYIEKMMVPLEEDGIEQFELRSPKTPDNKTPLEVVLKEEKEYFTAPPSSDNIEELPTSREEEITVKVTSPVFVKGQKWRLSDGNSTFWASMEDKEFWDKVEKGELSFSNGDMLRIRYYIRQSVKGGTLSSDYIMTKVLDIRRHPIQIELDFDNR